jgi:hypothetical protein
MEMKERKIRCNLGTKGCPHERQMAFNDWIRKELPDSKTGFITLDIDHIFINLNSKKLLIIEKKTFNAKFNTEVDFAQKQFLLMIRKIFMQLPNIIEGWKFLDIHLIQFDGFDFETGDVYFDGNKIEEQELKKILSI